MTVVGARLLTFAWPLLLSLILPGELKAQCPPHICTHVIPYTLSVTKFDPAIARENRPFRTYFELLNRRQVPLSGRVAYVGNADASLGAPTREITNLQPGKTFKGYVVGIAPEPGAQVLVTLAFYDNDYVAGPGVESFEPQSHSYGTIDVEGVYEFRVDSLVVNETRSKVKDTLIAETTATYNSEPLPHPKPEYPSDRDVPKLTQAVVIGHKGNGERVKLPFAFGPFASVPGEAKNLDFNYAVVNSGYEASGYKTAEKVLNAISTAGASLATASTGYGGVWQGLDKVHHLFNGAMFANCDGVVALHSGSVSSANLARLTLSGPHRTSYSEMRKFPGTTSPDGCGPSSAYEVQFTIVRLSAFGF